MRACLLASSGNFVAPKILVVRQREYDRVSLGRLAVGLPFPCAGLWRAFSISKKMVRIESQKIYTALESGGAVAFPS